MNEDFTELRTITLLMDNADDNRLRQFANRHHLGDSAIALRRILDCAEAAERAGLVGEHGHPNA